MLKTFSDEIFIDYLERLPQVYCIYFSSSDNRFHPRLSSSSAQSYAGLPERSAAT